MPKLNRDLPELDPDLEFEINEAVDQIRDLRERADITHEEALQIAVDAAVNAAREQKVRNAAAQKGP